MFSPEILKIGHPLLRACAQEIRNFEEVRELSAFMKEIITRQPWSGVAAPQLGQGVRMVSLHMPPEVAARRGEEVRPPRILINPVITPIGSETREDWEACLSLPDLMGRVVRPVHIHLRAVDEVGNPVDEVAQDHYARILQHECDHLDGILYVDRMTDMKKLIYKDQFHLWQDPA